jgi:hypothetical protein
LKLYRNDFKSVVQTATYIAKNWGIKPEFRKKNISQRVKHFDELAKDSGLNESGKSFEINVFNKSLDIILMQLKERCLGLQSVVNLFSCLLRQQMLSYTDDELFDAATNLANAHPDDLTKDLGPQIKPFRSSFKTKIKRFDNVYDLAFMLIVENYVLATTLPDLCTAFLLLLTLPITVGASELSFSKLKLIKNYLRSSMGQMRLSGLAVISIERDRAIKLDVSVVIRNFAESKARRKNFDK